MLKYDDVASVHEEETGKVTSDFIGIDHWEPLKKFQAWPQPFPMVGACVRT